MALEIKVLIVDEPESRAEIRRPALATSTLSVRPVSAPKHSQPRRSCGPTW